MDLAAVLTLASGVAGAVAGRKAGKSEKIGGDKQINRVLEPLAAIAAGSVANAVIDPSMDWTGVLEHGGQLAVYGFLIHRVVLGLVEVIKALTEYRKAKA